MLERSEKALRLLCLILGAGLLLQVVLKVTARNPLSGLKIPELPTLSAEADSGANGRGTNPLASKAAGPHAGSKQTNSLASGQTNEPGTKLLAKTSTTQERHSVHRSTSHRGDTNAVAAEKAVAADTNAVASHAQGTNALAESATPAANSNALARADSNSGSTNSSHTTSSGKPTHLSAPSEMAMSGPHASSRPGMGKRAPDLPLPILARVDRVVDSELFGPVFHPMPEGLLGIAGNMAFLRAASGQTGAVKEGDELGGLKLLRIGINRVLVEEDGQQKELMIFQGLGGQSLLPK